MDGGGLSGDTMIGTFLVGLAIGVSFATLGWMKIVYMACVIKDRWKKRALFWESMAYREEERITNSAAQKVESYRWIQ